MTTSGDEGASSSGSPQGLKGLFIDTILDALDNGAIDLAVHSAKDLPAEDDEGYTIAAVPLRENPHDVLITRGPSLPDGSRVGTSSPRRRAQILRAFPAVTVVDLRGNVGTRLRRVEEGDIDAAVLASAGLARLGLAPAHATELTLEQMVPAPGQGALAVQCRDDDEDVRSVLASIDHRDSHTALEAERSVMWRLGGGCALPLGAYATVDEEGGVHLVAVVATADGDRLFRAEAARSTAEAAAAAVTKDLLAEGAEKILADLLEES